MSKPRSRGIRASSSKRRAPHRPSFLELHPEIAKIIIDRIGMGAFLETAAAEAGIEINTVRTWVRKGNAERLRRRRVDDDRDAEEADDQTRGRRMRGEERERRLARDQDDAATRIATESYVKFACDIERAQALGEHALLSIITRAAMGGVVVARTIRTDANGNTSTSERFSEPSWNAAAWRLERRAPKRWGPKVEHRIDDMTPASERGQAAQRLARAIERDLAAFPTTEAINGARADTEGDDG